MSTETVLQWPTKSKPGRSTSSSPRSTRSTAQVDDRLGQEELHPHRMEWEDQWPD